MKDPSVLKKALVVVVIANMASAVATEEYNAAGLGGVASVCKGWPAPDSAFVNETNYSNPDLPDLLTFLNGTIVPGPGAAWEERKEEIKTLLMKYFYGTLPHETPPLVAVDAAPQTEARGGISYMVNLTFLTLSKKNVSFAVEVIRPSRARQGRSERMPLFITETNHRRWALKAVARGYVVCLYPGADVNDKSVEFQKAYPDATWGTIFARSWIASRALDYLLSLPFVDSTKVSISGHSRNAKEALLATAFDARISAVVSSSSGSPGMTPYRLTSANTFAEGPGGAPENWWLPQLTCFKGYEHRLPIDSHGLIALIAPRPLLAATAWTDGCEPTWAVERAYKAGRAVYRMYGAAQNLRIKYRPGQHHGFLDVDSYFDWFDTAFGHEGFTSHELFPEALVQDFDWHAWARMQPSSAVSPPSGSTRHERIAWGLGVAPDTFTSPGGHYGEQCEPGPTAGGCYVAEMMTHDRFAGRAGKSVQRHDVNFGEYISASLYTPANHFENEALPVVIWMHPMSYHSGFNEGYIDSESGTAIYFDVASNGFAVIAFDAMGFGSRGYEFNGAAGGPQGQEGSPPLFYRRYPEWSILGKIVHDGLAAVDLAVGLSQGRFPGDDPPLGVPRLDPKRVYVMGYDVGGRAALYMGALDPDRRLAGLISINGWTPMRGDTNASTTGGIRQLWDWHGLQPRLGFYDGKERELPYDMDDVLAQAAPIPTLIYQQLYDRTADAGAVAKSVSKAVAMGANVTLLTAATVNTLNDEVHNRVIDWLKDQAHPSSGEMYV